jgi:hypothetical protein
LNEGSQTAKRSKTMPDITLSLTTSDLITGQGWEHEWNFQTPAIWREINGMTLTVSQPSQGKNKDLARLDQGAPKEFTAADVLDALDKAMKWAEQTPHSSPPPRNDEEWVTLRQAAAILGKSEQTVRNRIKKGELHAEKRGRQDYIKKKDLL